MFNGASDEVQALNALWTLHVTGGLSDEIVRAGLNSRHEYVRAWTIQLLCEKDQPNDGLLKKFAEMAANDRSPVVRLYLASAMQRTEPGRRWEVITNLMKHEEDIADHNLPLMYWYAAEPSIAADPARGIKLIGETRIPKLRQFIARRVTSTSKSVATK